MHIVKMFITLVVIVVCDHFIGIAFETHALVAATACYSVTAVCSDDWHLAVFVWACSHAILLHVFLE